MQAIHVMECLEFRQLLLLLRNNLKDSDIPHRTKTQELVLQAWRDYFVALKADLKVSHWSVCGLALHLMVDSSTESCRRNIFHIRPMVCRQS